MHRPSFENKAGMECDGKEDSMNSYVFSVKVMPGCYRHIQMNGNATMKDLADVILRAFEFDNDHMSSFFMSNKAYDSKTEIAVPGMVGSTSGYNRGQTADHFVLDSMHFMKGQKFVYVFDFGDDWRFQCYVLKVREEPCEGDHVMKAVGAAPSQYGWEDF